MANFSRFRRGRPAKHAKDAKEEDGSTKDTKENTKEENEPRITRMNADRKRKMIAVNTKYSVVTLNDIRGDFVDVPRGKKIVGGSHYVRLGILEEEKQGGADRDRGSHPIPTTTPTPVQAPPYAFPVERFSRVITTDVKYRDGTYWCRQCEEYSTTSETFMRKHLVKVHRLENPKLPVIVRALEKPPDPVVPDEIRALVEAVPGGFVCMYCEREFDGEESLKAHVQKNHQSWPDDVKENHKEREEVRR